MLILGYEYNLSTGWLAMTTTTSVCFSLLYGLWIDAPSNELKGRGFNEVGGRV